MPIVARRFVAVAAVVVLAAGLAACASSRSTQTASLYDRLGGKPAITAVVDQFVANVAGDTRINHFFAKTDAVAFKAKLVDQICQASAGPCKYTGKDMRTAHAGRNITDADFNALVEDLVAALDKFNVPAKEKDELIGLLAPMKGDIVGV